MEPTTILGVPERPVAFPVTLPVKFPLKVVAVTIPPLISTDAPTLSVEKVETPVEFISPLTLHQFLSQ